MKQIYILLSIVSVSSYLLFPVTELILALLFYYKVCEKSISGSDAAPSSPAALEFVRGSMLASGYMIRSSGGASTIHLVEHLDLEVQLTYLPKLHKLHTIYLL